MATKRPIGSLPFEARALLAQAIHVKLNHRYLLDGYLCAHLLGRVISGGWYDKKTDHTLLTQTKTMLLDAKIDEENPIWMVFNKPKGF